MTLLSVKDFTKKDYIDRELILFKIDIDEKNKSKVVLILEKNNKEYDSINKDVYEFIILYHKQKQIGDKYLCDFLKILIQKEHYLKINYYLTEYLKVNL